VCQSTKPKWKGVRLRGERLYRFDSSVGIGTVGVEINRYIILLTQHDELDE